MTEANAEAEAEADEKENADADADENENEDAKADAKAGADARDGARAAERVAEVRARWGFPAFARDFPDDATLTGLVEAFAAGDYATVRAGAPALAAKTTDANVKRAAELLRARIEPDPTSRVFFALAAALLVFLMAWWATHDGKQHKDHDASSSPPGKPAPTVETVK